MSRNYYSEINLHAIWHTKGSQPLLHSQLETETHHYLINRLLKTPNVYFHAIGGTENHVHLVCSIAPTVLISDWIGSSKGPLPMR